MNNERFEKLSLVPQSQLALMTTSSGRGHHTYSVYLTESEEEEEGGGGGLQSIMMIRNMTFKLLISYPDNLNPYKLLLGLHLDYYKHLSDRIVKEKKDGVVVEDFMKPILSRIVCLYREMIQVLERNTGLNYFEQINLLKKELDCPGFFFDSSFQPFFVHRGTKIERQLRGKGTIQRLLAVDNHLIVAYFVERFKSPLLIGGTEWEIQALEYDSFHNASPVINTKEAAVNYVLKQIPHCETAKPYVLLYKEALKVEKCVIQPAFPDIKLSQQVFSVDYWRKMAIPKPSQLAFNVFAFQTTQFNKSVSVVDYKKTRRPEVKITEGGNRERKKVAKVEKPENRVDPQCRAQPKSGKRSLQPTLNFPIKKQKTS
jgi:hypothetical protein